jgi:hypothetical protein
MLAQVVTTRETSQRPSVAGHVSHGSPSRHTILRKRSRFLPRAAWAATTTISAGTGVQWKMRHGWVPTGPCKSMRIHARPVLCALRFPLCAMPLIVSFRLRSQCYTADPLHKWECCAVPRCAGQPAARCPIWCCPSDYPAYLQPTLFILPPLGITLLVGAICCLRVGRRRRQGGRSSAAWPERPRFRSTAGALALFGFFLSNLAGMPALLYANDLWEPRTSNSLLPLQPVGLLLSLLLVRPSDRSVKVLGRLVAVLCFIFLLLSGSLFI